MDILAPVKAELWYLEHFYPLDTWDILAAVREGAL